MLLSYDQSNIAYLKTLYIKEEEEEWLLCLILLVDNINCFKTVLQHIVIFFFFRSVLFGVKCRPMLFVILLIVRSAEYCLSKNTVNEKGRRGMDALPDSAR